MIIKKLEANLYEIGGRVMYALKKCYNKIFIFILSLIMLINSVNISYASNIAVDSTENYMRLNEETKSEIEQEDVSESLLLDEFMKTLPRLSFEENPKLRIIIEAKDDKESVKSQILKIEGAEIIYEYKQLINGFSIDIPKNKLEELFLVEGIKNLDYSDELIPAMINAKELTNVLKAKQRYEEKYTDRGKLDGRGMVIASLDSGVDIYSDDLKLDAGDTQGIDSDVYQRLKIKDYIFTNKDGTPNFKVPYAFNYFRGDNISIDEVPKPHGMHIAGILTGNSGTEGGFKGIAPNAQLLVYKVITYDRKSDTRPDLVEYVGEDAAFHAMEDAISRGADIISLSIGNQGTGAANDIWNSAVKKAYEKGVVVVAAMGNWASSNSESSYDIYADQGIELKDNSSTVSVAANSMAIGVGSTYNTKLQLPSIKIGDLEEIPYKDISKFNNINIPEDIISCPIVYVDRGMDGYTTDSDFENIRGKIVLARRGGEAVKDKALRFLKKGAKGFILVNDVTDFSRGNNDTHPIIGFEHLTIEDGWAIGISGNSGKMIREYIENNAGDINISFDKQEREVQLKEKTGISGFSSWGPNYDLEIKPDLIAPGEDIYSLGNRNTYTIMSGTSMSSPHVAGIATLILQSIKDSGVEIYRNLGIGKVDFIKILLMNTAHVLKDNERQENEDIYEYSPRRQGAGFVDLDAALLSEVLVRYKNKGSISLGELSQNRKDFTLRIDNFGDRRKKFNIRTSEVLHEITVDRTRNNEYNSYETKTLHLEPLDGAFIKAEKEVSIPAKSFVELSFSLDVSTAENEFVEGFIYFDAKDEGQSDLSIPYMGFKGEWNKENILDTPVWDENTKTNLNTLFSIKPGHHGDNDYIEMGREGNYTKGREDEELKINPEYFALNNKNRHFNTVINEVVPRLIFLRNVDTYEVSIVDREDVDAVPVAILNTAHYPRKYIHNIFRENTKSGYDKPNDFNKWKGRTYNSKTGDYKEVEEGQYYYRIKAKLDKDTENYQTLFIPIKVDVTNPSMDVLYDKENSKVEINTQDNFGIWKVSASIDGVIQKVLKLEDNKYVIEDIKLSQITTGKLVVEAMDYAGNQAQKFQKNLNEISPTLRISNIERLVNNKDKFVKLEFEDDITNISVRNINDEEISLETNDNVASFKLSDLGQERTFIVEWTDRNGLVVRERYMIGLNPPEKKKEEEKKPKYNANDEFSYRDITLYPGLFFSYDKADKEMHWNTISYNKDVEGNLNDIKLNFSIYLKENLTAVITNINTHYNRLNGIDSYEPMQKLEIEYDDDEDQTISVANGTNLINVKVYKNNNSTSGIRTSSEEVLSNIDEADTRGELIYNRGFFVYIDTERPGMELDNQNIVYNSSYDNEEYVGRIYVSGNELKLEGSIQEDLDGITLSINDNIVENIILPGEFGYNGSRFSHTINVEDEDIIKLEVKDYSENSRELFFKVVRDDEAPEIEITPNTAEEITPDTILSVNITDNMEIDDEYGDNLLEKKVYVNGREYQNDELSNYMISGENKFNIVVTAKDKAGNISTKEIRANVESSLKENLEYTKTRFTIEELKDLSNIITLEDGVTGEIINTKIRENDNIAVMTIKLKDEYGFDKVYTVLLPLVEIDYTQDENLGLDLKRNEFRQDEAVSIEDLFDLPEDVGIVVIEPIDSSKSGEKTLKVKLFRNESYNILDYNINILPAKVILSYETENGESYPDEEYDKGSIIKLDKIPVKDGFEFVSWYKDRDFIYEIKEIELLENTRVFAKWKRIESTNVDVNTNVDENTSDIIINGGGRKANKNPSLITPLISKASENKKEQVKEKSLLLPIDTLEQKPQIESIGEKKTGNRIPKTEDNNNFAQLYIILMSSIVAAYILSKSKKYKNNKF